MPRLRFDRRLLPEAPDLFFETGLWARRLTRVAGIDEAGRGALAGPVTAAAVVLPADPAAADHLRGVDDSKRLTPAQRDVLAVRIIRCCAAHAVGKASAAEVDALGIAAAVRLAVRRALLALDPLPDHLLVDYIDLPEVPIPQTSLVKGDARCLSIAAASILAKTARDAEMDRLDGEHPGYGWRRNKGYGTAAHLDAIARLGPSPVHRCSFAPVRGMERGLDGK
ncbi:MAG TPA: ribonuclease HII [Anaerolineales bacterium]|nr:ribonuclease HII [Anaerolineales bacterium]